jgi:hypothetical protein
MLLSKPTGKPEHPGCMRDYIEVWDFDCNISRDGPKRFRVEIMAGLDGAGPN